MNLLARASLAALILGGSLSSAVSAQEGAEALLPENSLIYMGSADLDTFIKETKGKALGKILMEEEVQDFMEKPMGMLQGIVSQGLEMARAQEPKLADLDPMKMLTGPYGKSFMALTHIDLPGGEGQVPDLGLVVGIEPKEGAMDVFGMVLNMVQTMAKENGVGLTVEDKTFAGVGYQTTRFDQEGPPLCFAKIRGASILSLSEKTLQGMIQKAAGEGASLSKSAGFSRASAAIGGIPRGAPALFLDGIQLMALLDAGLDIAAANAPGEEDAQVIAMIKQGLAASGFLEAGVALTTSTWQGDVAVTRAYSEMNPQAGGLLGALAAISKPIDASLINLIPADALSFSLSNFDLTPAYDSAMSILKEVSPEVYSEVSMTMQGLEAQVGGVDEDGNPLWSIRDDLIDAVGGNYFSSTTPGEASMFGPANNTAIFVGCKNPAGLEKSLAHIIRLPGEMAGFPLLFKEEQYNGVTIKALDASSMGPAAMVASAIQPTYAIAGNRFYMASSPKALKGLLERLSAPPEKNVTSKPDFSRHFGALPEGAKLNSLSYSATATNFEDMYNVVLGVVPLAMMNMPMSQDELPIEMSLLPTAEAISQHLFGSASWSLEVAPGAYMTEARGPFGAEMAAVLAVGALAGAGVAGWTSSQQMGGMAPMVEAVPVTDPESQAWQDLRDISAAITVYTVEFQEQPASLQDLVSPKPLYPNGVLTRAGGVPTDPWGNNYVYQSAGDGYVLWSYGPNGENENGGGDDLKIDRR